VYRYAEELIRREQQQQQQQQGMIQDGGGMSTWSHVTSCSPNTTPPPTKRRRRAASPVRAPLLPAAENNVDDATSTAPRDVTAIMTSSSGRHVTDSSTVAVMGHVLATQFACPCPHCRDSKPTYIVPLDFVSAAAQIQHRSTAQI